MPGEKYDVMGATLLGVPLPLIGFNSTLGWTHTFSTDNRFTLRYLALDPSNPTRYLKDGVSKPMTAVPLSIQAKGADHFASYKEQASSRQVTATVPW